MIHNKLFRQLMTCILADNVGKKFDEKPPTGPVGSTGVWGRSFSIHHGVVADWTRIGTITGPGKVEWDERTPEEFRQVVGGRLAAGETAFSFPAGSKEDPGFMGGDFPAAINFIVVADECPPTLTDAEQKAAFTKTCDRFDADPILQIGFGMCEMGLDPTAGRK